MWTLREQCVRSVTRRVGPWCSLFSCLWLVLLLLLLFFFCSPDNHQAAPRNFGLPRAQASHHCSMQHRDLGLCRVWDITSNLDDLERLAAKMVSKAARKAPTVRSFVRSGNHERPTNRFARCQTWLGKTKHRTVLGWKRVVRLLVLSCRRIGKQARARLVGGVRCVCASVCT